MIYLDYFHANRVSGFPTRSAGAKISKPSTSSNATAVAKAGSEGSLTIAEESTSWGRHAANSSERARLRAEVERHGWMNDSLRYLQQEPILPASTTTTSRPSL